MFHIGDKICAIGHEGKEPTEEELEASRYKWFQIGDEPPFKVLMEPKPYKMRDYSSPWTEEFLSAFGGPSKKEEKKMTYWSVLFG